MDLFHTKSFRTTSAVLVHYTLEPSSLFLRVSKINFSYSKEMFAKVRAWFFCDAVFSDFTQILMLLPKSLYAPVTPFQNRLLWSPLPLPYMSNDVNYYMFCENEFKSLPSDWVVSGTLLSPSNDRQLWVRNSCLSKLAVGGWWCLVDVHSCPLTSFLLSSCSDVIFLSSHRTIHPSVLWKLYNSSPWTLWCRITSDHAPRAYTVALHASCWFFSHVATRLSVVRVHALCCCLGKILLCLLLQVLHVDFNAIWCSGSNDWLHGCSCSSCVSVKD